ncbi:MAG: ribose-5-phosphate isomerase RpiA [Saprospiraceae bacterium]
MSKDLEKENAAKEAVKLVKPGQIVGLGTGSTALFAIQEIGKLVSQGLQIQAVPSSERTKALAESLHIPLLDINAVDAIDLTIDGADEFTPELRLIKGGGGALLREKIIASLTRQEIIIADSSKQVQVLGKFKVPLAVTPFAVHYVLHQLPALNGTGELRMTKSGPFVTDDGNHIIDADFGLIPDPERLSQQLNDVEGVVAHGLFIGLANTVIMGARDTTVTFTSPPSNRSTGSTPHRSQT